MKIEFYIDELVLHGFPHNDRYLISTAIENELVQMLATRGAPSGLTHGGAFSQFNAGQFQMASNARADAIGAQVAQAVYEILPR